MKADETKEGKQFAVIATGGKQYLVAPGSVVRVEKLPAGEDEQITFSEVLLIADGESVQIGTPVLEGASVTGTVVWQGRANKVWGVKFKPKKRQKTTFGHRQHYTEVRIKSIQAS